MGDDDLEDIPTKMIKLDDDAHESEVCVICMNRFTTTGNHKIISLKCGHVFGLKCIEEWLNTDTGRFCPTCKQHCTRKDMRPLFLNVRTIRMEDNEELVGKTEELAKTKSELKIVNAECSQLKLMNKLLSIETTKLQEENKQLLAMRDMAQYQQQQTQIYNKDELPKSNGMNFQLTQKLLISAIGNCRVMGYSPLDNKICISCPSSNHIVTGYGVRVVDVAQGKVKKYIALHSMVIRNIAFNSTCSTSLMLSCSHDKSVKMTSIHNDSVVSSFSCSHQVWSCAWSNNNDIIYAGLSNGNIEEIDCRKTSSPISTIITLSGGPVLSMQYVRANDHCKARGLLVTNSQGVVFLRNSSSQTTADDGLSEYQLDTLLMSSKYGSTLVDTAFNDRTYHLLNTFRPSASKGNVRYLFSAIGSRANEFDAMYASDVHSLYGSRSLEYMTRSSFIVGDANSSGSVNLAVGANEETSSIRVWDLDSNFRYLDLYPKDVTRQKPILDLCQYSSDPISFAAINSENLYLYRNFE